jgi:hypothetical protein
MRSPTKSDQDSHGDHSARKGEEEEDLSARFYVKIGA